MEVITMKKLLSILVIFAMVFVSSQAVFADDTVDNGPEYCLPHPPEECNWRDNYSLCDITTEVTIAGETGGDDDPPGGPSGNSPPVVKCKWEYDEMVEIDVGDCDVCYGCINGDCVVSDMFYHDACPCTPGLQVLPVLGSTVTVGYYAVVFDPDFNLDHVYADIWHPDGEFKYQIELVKKEREEGLQIWDHVISCHPDLIAYNEEYFAGMSDWDGDILHQIDQQLAHVFHVTAELSYCQPGGHYTVGVRGQDSFNAWSDYLYNQFWYIPTTAINKDFSHVNYGSAIISRFKWVGGNTEMDGPMSNFPTIQNWGNTPIRLFVWQDDMGLGFTGQPSEKVWNVEYDIRLSAAGTDIFYDPYESAPGYKGVEFGQLGLCTQEKVDFSVHVKKADPGTYFGNMCIIAYRLGNPVGIGTEWETPSQFVGSAPGQVVQDIYDPNPGEYGPDQP
jgi:hypothetical protein